MYTTHQFILLNTHALFIRRTNTIVRFATTLQGITLSTWLLICFCIHQKGFYCKRKRLCSKESIWGKNPNLIWSLFDWTATHASVLFSLNPIVFRMAKTYFKMNDFSEKCITWMKISSFMELLQELSKIYLKLQNKWVTHNWFSKNRILQNMSGNVQVDQYLVKKLLLHLLYFPEMSSLT